MNYDNLKFPKQGKKKRKKPKLGKYPCERQKESIIPGDKKGRCYICGSHVNIQNHHIFFGNGNRKNSDYCGLTVHLCLEHHKEGKMSAHKNREVNYRLSVPEFQQKEACCIREMGESPGGSRKAEVQKIHLRPGYFLFFEITGHYSNDIPGNHRRQETDHIG